MSKIIDKINLAIACKKDGQTIQPYFSLEFFPPKTEAGVENLYIRMDRMTSLQPIFIDITWGAGGSTKDLTIAIAEYTQTYFGVDVLMHLTCTSMTNEDLKEVLLVARKCGIRNILALRGDPPKNSTKWKPIPNGCNNTIDLVKLIRQEHGDYFGIAVAGFPEGHPQNMDNMDEEMQFLKEKVDAGVDFILTQFFYDPIVFIDFVERCRNISINCPIIPGMMPIQSYISFQRMTSFCGTRVPVKIWQDLEPIRDDDEAVKAYGVEYCTEMCKTLLAKDIVGFHFYTLNLEKSVISVLKELGIDDSVQSRRSFPWRGARTPRADQKGSIEEVRPINWANRPKSYIKRTTTWDEFPNGRWGDGRSPAFGDLAETHFYKPEGGTKEDRLAMWGESPISKDDVYSIFAKYLEGNIPIIPWCESPLSSETNILSSPLTTMNRHGFLTINSQPAVNGEKSDNADVGWGGVGGRVYQKAYVEFFTSPENLKLVIDTINKKYPNLNYHAVDCTGNTFYSSGHKNVTTLTWGVFPNKGILQPTVFHPDTFLVWSKEAFQLWLTAWAALYDDETDSCALMYDIHDTFYLVAIIDNDYFDSELYNLFKEVIEKKEDSANESDGSLDSGIIEV